MITNMPKTKSKLKKYWEIKETWRVSGEIEKYETKLSNLKEVASYIKDWIENWQENAEFNGYKFLGFKTDYKKYCKLRIDTGEFMGDRTIDSFSLIVKKL